MAVEFAAVSVVDFLAPHRELLLFHWPWTLSTAQRVAFVPLALDS